ncbi:MAG: glycoside hydrolase domain-containing protein [Planctomycetota bacterium]
MFRKVSPMNRMFTLPKVQAGRCRPLILFLLTVLVAAGSLRAEQPAKAGLKGDIAYYPTPGVLEIRPDEIFVETPDGQVGLRGEYYPNANLNGEPAFTRRDRDPRFNWKKGRPEHEGDASLPEDGFSVQWTGRLAEVPRTDKYRLHFTGDGIRVWINGEKLVDAWEEGGNVQEDVTLEKGSSPKIRIEYQHREGKAEFKCRVRPLGRISGQMLHTPEGDPGVKVEWFEDNKLEGEPGSEKTMERISYGKFRAPGIQSKTYSGRWTTVFGPAPASGTYLFDFTSSDGLRVWIDGLKRFEDWTEGKVKHTERVKLQEGEKVKLRAEMYHKPHGAPVMKMKPRLALDSLSAWETSGTLAVLNEAGEPVQEKECTWNRLADRFFVDINDLEPGMHTVQLSGEPYNNSLGEKVYYDDYEWQGNKLGITDKIYDPFKPVSVEENTVEVVRRRYQLGALGLPAQIEADDQEEETDYRELLADPVAITVNGEELSGQDGSFTTTTKRQAVYEGNANHPAVRVGTRTETEFDGCMRVEMTLEPGEQEDPLKSMTLDIPMRDEMAPLFHVVKGCTPIRNNPAGSTPEGQGRIWRSAEMKDSRWPGNFKPYLYLGGPERGLSWFADNEKGWVMDWTRTPSCQTLHRKNGKLILRVHLVQKPTVIKEPRTITFGLMASPAKPMPQDWREVGQPGSKEIMFRMGHLFGRDAVFSAKYPRGKDYSPFAKFHAQRKGEQVDINGFVEEWAEKHLHEEMTDDLQKR